MVSVPDVYSEPLRTERLILRRFVPEDLAPYYANHSQPETARYLLGEAHSYAECMERVGRFSRSVFEGEGDWASFALEKIDSPGFVGEVVLKWESGGDMEHGLVGEIGWTLAPEGRGQGFATEAAQMILRKAFLDWGFHRVEARLDSRNAASARICERLGMRHEATLAENMFLKGEWTSESIYGILREGWKAAHTL